jgi:hypothetical protein
LGRTVVQDEKDNPGNNQQNNDPENPAFAGLVRRRNQLVIRADGLADWPVFKFSQWGLRIEHD